MKSAARVSSERSQKSLVATGRLLVRAVVAVASLAIGFAMIAGSGEAVARKPSVTVPKLIGEPVGTARQRVKRLGLAPKVVHVHSLRIVNTVIAQHPRAGARVARGTRVTISVSSGPGP